MKLPILVFLLSLVGLWLSVKLGTYVRRRLKVLDDEGRADFNVIQAATLTLLGIIIGFSFSMAVSRYDQRKSCEAEEANSIGTEFLRVELLPVPDAAAAKELLKRYLDQRIAWYQARDSGQLDQIIRDTSHVQVQLWSAVRKGAEGQPAAVVLLTVSGVNDALNSEGYTQAAWLNSIPPAAWIMMQAVAFVGALLLGIGTHRPTAFMSLILPFMVSVAFFFIADLDSPRRGLIRVHPENLLSLSESLNQGQN